MIDIALLAGNAWTALQPYIPVLATKVVDEISKKVPETVTKLWDAVKEKMESKPETASIPADLANKPDNTAVQGAFQYQLEKLLENDEAFKQQLDALVKEAKNVTVTTMSATLTGDGAIALGENAKAVGTGGVMIGGNVTGNINTGDSEPSGPGGGRPKKK